MRARRLGTVALLALCAGTPLALPAQSGERTLVHRGERRSYVVRMPSREAADTTRRPLVIVLHGGGGNAANAERMTGFTRKARDERFVVAYPNGSGRLRRSLLTWNAGHCCGFAMERRVDDVGFIAAMIDTLVATAQVDPRRIYVTGMSNGAMMAHRLGIELAPRIAAIAPVVGGVFGDERMPEGPVAALIMNGALDRNVPPAGGAPGGRGTDAWDGTPLKPAEAQGEFWARVAACDPTPEVRSEGQARVARYRCPAGRAVEWYLVLDNGHAWPGGSAGSRRGDAPSRSLDATTVIWEFFKRQGKAAP